MNSKELIELCLLGDQDGQRLLYEKFVTAMARLCFRYLKDETDVQDVLIDGFMNVYENLKRFEYRGEQSLEIWIRKIMINQCLMRLRKKRSSVWIDYSKENLETVRGEDVDLSATEILEPPPSPSVLVNK